jgi:surfeit locus 1 family protein
MILLKMFSRSWLLTTLLALAGAGVCLRLGIWQLDRLEQRRAFNAHYESMRAAAPVQLPADSDQDLIAMEYRAVEVAGEYDFSQQVALRNQYFRDQYGYHLLTPLVMANGSAVLVDRGWIPAEGNDTPSAWRKYDEGGAVTMQGIIRLGRATAEMGGLIDPTPGPGQARLDLWIMPNIAAIQAQTSYQLLPIYIQLDEDPADSTPPVPDQPEVEITEGPHFGYALQWFTFAAILLMGYPFYVRHHEGANK